MGGWERDPISDIRPPKNQISDITPPKKIKYQISDPNQNQISDITPLKKKFNIRYQGTPVPPPPPPIVSDCPQIEHCVYH